MVFKAWDHQKTIQHIDFMYINGHIIIYHRFFERKSFILFCLRRQKSIYFCISFNLFCLRRQKSIFFCIFRLQNAKSVVFLSCRYSPETQLKRCVSKIAADSAKNHGKRCSERRAASILLEHQNFGPNVVYYFFDNFEKNNNLGLLTELYANPLP